MDLHDRIASLSGRGYSRGLPRDDERPILISRIFPRYLDMLDFCRGWPAITPAYKALHTAPRALEHGLDTAVGQILDPPVEAGAFCLVSSIGAIVDILHTARNENVCP